MSSIQDGPKSSLFVPLTLKGNVSLSKLAGIEISNDMSAALEHAPRGTWVAWGIPFEIGDVVAIASQAVSVEFSPTTARWFVFMHTSDLRPLEPGQIGRAHV